MMGALDFLYRDAFAVCIDFNMKYKTSTEGLHHFRIIFPVANPPVLKKDMRAELDMDTISSYMNSFSNVNGCGVLSF